jgi:uncharacterized SAM-binding protein YcdF (DUF218 family)
MLDDLAMQLGLAGWKPVAAALLLPPLPLLLLMFLGAWVLRRRPAWGWALMIAGGLGIWLCSSSAAGDFLTRQLLHPLQPLGTAELQSLRAQARGGGGPRTAIVVLGAGRERHAPEYGAANLTPQAVERLRYGLWLSRETGLPLAFSGGSGHAQRGGPAEAEVAAVIAARDFGRKLSWVEAASADTRGNARHTVAMLRSDGVTRILLVTHGWHLRRSLRAFDQAAAQAGAGLQIVPAPMGLAGDDARPLLRWLPSSKGFADTRSALREWFGLWAGA